MDYDAFRDAFLDVLRESRLPTIALPPNEETLDLRSTDRGRKGMSWTEEDWIDEDATSHRGDDD